MLKKLSYSLLLIAFFLYGLAVGQYHIFPFEQVQTVKNLILKKDYSSSFIRTPYYLHKTTFFKFNHMDQYDVVFVGDSITDNSNWNEIFADISIANRGISGDTTAGVLNRMDTILNTGAKQAFVMIGTNDIMTNEDVDTIFGNYIKILNALESKNIKPIVQSTLLTSNKQKKQNENINKLNAKLRDYCNQTNTIYVDLNKYLAANGELNNKYSSDGLHLNGEGYSVWSKVISGYIKN